MRLSPLPRNVDHQPRLLPRPDPTRGLPISECRQLAHELLPFLETHLRFPRPEAALYSSGECLAVPLLADLKNSSPEGAAREAHLLLQFRRGEGSREIPSSDTALRAVHTLSPERLHRDLQGVLDAQIALAREEGCFTSEEPLILAGDCHDIPTFHRKHPRKVAKKPRASKAFALAVRGPEKGGTTYFHRHLTLYTTRGVPLTVAVRPRLPLDELHLEMRTGLDEAERRVGRKADLLLYDGGAFGTPVLGMLQERGSPFIVRAPQHKRIAEILRIREQQGLTSFALRNYTILATTARSGDPGVTVTLVGVSRKLLESVGIDLPKAEERTKWFTFATNLSPEPGESDTEFALRVFLLYSERWDVETSYRQISDALGFTHALDYGVRLLLWFLAVFLTNLWAFQRHRTGQEWKLEELLDYLRAGLLLLGDATEERQEVPLEKRVQVDAGGVGPL